MDQNQGHQEETQNVHINSTDSTALELFPAPGIRMPT